MKVIKKGVSNKDTPFFNMNNLLLPNSIIRKERHQSVWTCSAPNAEQAPNTVCHY